MSKEIEFKVENKTDFSLGISKKEENSRKNSSSETSELSSERAGVDVVSESVELFNTTTLDIFSFDSFESLMEELKFVTLDELQAGFELLRGEFINLIQERKAGLISSDNYHNVRARYNSTMSSVSRLITIKKKENKSTNKLPVNTLSIEEKSAIDLKSFEDLTKDKNVLLSKMIDLKRYGSDSMSTDAYKDELSILNSKAMYIQKKITLLGISLKSQGLLKKDEDSDFYSIKELVLGLKPSE